MGHWYKPRKWEARHVEIRVLGQVRVVGTATSTLPRMAERCVLAVLAFNVGRPVSVDQLVNAIWDDRPPDKAEETVASHVRTVRRLVGLAGGERSSVHNRRPRSYELRLDPAVVDYHRFGMLTAAARARARTGESRAVIAAYQNALELWRGDPLEDVTTVWAERRRYAIQGEYLEAVHGLIDAQLTVGEHHAVVARVRPLVEVAPTDQLLVAGIKALAGSGRQAEIASFMRHATTTMWTVAGVRPGPGVRELARRLMAERMPVEPRPSAAPVDHRAGSIIMIATNNDGPVHQSAGDQVVN